MSRTGHARLIACSAFSLIAALVGCQEDTKTTEGSIALAVTDAASDKLESFQVNLTGIVLRTAEGTETELLDSSVRIDLAALGDVSEVFKMLNAEEATYTSGTVTIDWSSAAAWIAGEDDEATILDGNGAARSGTETLIITFPADSVKVVAGALRLFEFDFDLDRSAEVDTAANTVTVTPSILLRVDRGDQKTLYLAGSLQGATSGGSMTLSVERPGGDTIGALTCAVANSTVFQVDGIPGTGANGYNALVGLGADARVEVYGDLDRAIGTIAASYVEAGVGTIGGGTAVVDGIVTARTGGPQAASPVLTVLGNRVDASGNALAFDTSYTVNASLANTRVLELGSATPLTTNAINVGQRVRVYGALSGTTMNATGLTSVVRLWPTRIFGFAKDVGGSLGLDLRQVGFGAPSAINWSVSGTTQADAANFSLSIEDPDAPAVDIGAQIEALGFFPSVNASGADFAAQFLADRTAASTLRIVYPTASSTALDSVSATGIDISVAGATLAVADEGFAGNTTISSSNLLELIPPSSGAMYFSIWRDDALVTYVDFAGFAADLAARKAGGAKVLAIRGLGEYDATAHTYEAAIVTVVLD